MIAEADREEYRSETVLGVFAIFEAKHFWSSAVPSSRDLPELFRQEERKRDLLSANVSIKVNRKISDRERERREKR